MIRIFRIISMLSIGILLCFAQSGLRFIEEDLSFEIQDSIFSVQGIYYFHSNTENSYPILYPFPTDTIYGKAYNIYVQDVLTGESIAFQIKTDTAFVSFLLHIHGEKPVLISYKQKLLSNKARYILMSTHSWKRALERVEFKLLIPLDMDIRAFSIPPDNELILDKKKMYLWQKEHFMPECDFEILF